MIPNMDGLGELMIIGAICVMIVITLIPPAVIYGLFWLGESRIGLPPHMAWGVAQFLWGALMAYLFWIKK